MQLSLDVTCKQTVPNAFVTFHRSLARLRSKQGTPERRTLEIKKDV